MVHNGIEYGDMQLICEVYDLMKRGLGLTNAEMHAVFTEWNQGELDSYLIEITRDILGYKDEEGKEVVDLILDAAGQKGTGKWTVVAALDDGMPLTLIGEAVFARCLSAVKEERVAASQQIDVRSQPFKGDKTKFANDIRRRCTPRRSSVTRKATSSCAPPRRPTSGTSTTAVSRSCGAAAASSVAHSSATSRRRSSATRNS